MSQKKKVGKKNGEQRSVNSSVRASQEKYNPDDLLIKSTEWLEKNLFSNELSSKKRKSPEDYSQNSDNPQTPSNIFDDFPFDILLQENNNTDDNLDRAIILSPKENGNNSTVSENEPVPSFSGENQERIDFNTLHSSNLNLRGFFTPASPENNKNENPEETNTPDFWFK